jgi:hypothetical protein
MKNEKQCLYCKKMKSLDDYHKKSNAKDGHDSRCKDCIYLYNKTGQKPYVDYSRKRAEKNPYSMATWQARLDRIKDVVIAPNEDGEYRLRINGGDDLPASDIEVMLWLKVENLTARLEEIANA